MISKRLRALNSQSIFENFRRPWSIFLSEKLSEIGQLIFLIEFDCSIFCYLSLNVKIVQRWPVDLFFMSVSTVSNILKWTIPPIRTIFFCLRNSELSFFRSCRGDNIRDLMKDLKNMKEELEVKYPKSVRERMAKINKVNKDLDEKLKKTEKVSFYFAASIHFLAIFFNLKKLFNKLGTNW